MHADRWEEKPSEIQLDTLNKYHPRLNKVTP